MADKETLRNALRNALDTKAAALLADDMSAAMTAVKAFWAVCDQWPALHTVAMDLQFAQSSNVNAEFVPGYIAQIEAMAA